MSSVEVSGQFFWIGHFIMSLRSINLLMTCCLLFFVLRKILAVSLSIPVGERLKKETIELLTLIYRANVKRDKKEVLQEGG